MRLIWLSALKDLRRLRRDPLALLLWVGIPLFVLLLIYALFGRERPKPQGLLLVADEDSSPLSALVSVAFQQGPLGELLRLEKMPREQARREVERGKASALLVIPEGFSGAVLRMRPAQLILVTNPAQRIVPGIIEESTSVLVEAIFYVQQLAGEEMKALAEGATTSPEQAAEIGLRLRRLGEQVACWLRPLRIQLESQIVKPSRGNGASLGIAFLSGMIFLALLFTAQGLSMDLWRERRRGTLRRWLGGPRTARSLLGGKLAAATLVFMAVSAAGLACGVWIAELSPRRVLPGTLWCALSGGMLFLLIVLLEVHAASERAAHILTCLVLFPMILLGGNLFPFEVMPAAQASHRLRAGRARHHGHVLAADHAHHGRRVAGFRAEPGNFAAAGRHAAASGRDCARQECCSLDARHDPSGLRHAGRAVVVRRELGRELGSSRRAARHLRRAGGDAGRVAR